jgi:hypothetical protein
MAAYPGVRVPGGGMFYGPYTHPRVLVRFWWIPAALLLIAAGLIFANGVALLSPAFFATWVNFLPWVAQLGSFAFILGVMMGMVILGAVLLLFFGFRVLAAFMIFPAAIVSLFIGGGFLAGTIIGVLAGIILIMNEKVWHP